jgi:GrpB-like predicted nucleotidyltransferase (UPF0157 family)
MGKKLEEMSLEELWLLFPIALTEHKEYWASWYSEESAELEKTLAGLPVSRISHIGSTAVPTIWAKPIIDILVEVELGSDMRPVKEALKDLGYYGMSEEAGRISFRKGYTEDGFAERAYHLHLRYEGDNDELYFRDYLRDNTDVAKEYERLKLGLWKRYEHDRDAYTDSKGEFILKHTSEARNLYKEKYS